jgi:hypothetical protein
MKQIKPSELLIEEIRLLESKQAYELQLMRKQFYITAERLKPANLIANTLKEMITITATGNKFIDNSIGMATGFLSKKFLFGSSANPVKKIFGTLLQFGISNVVYKNTFAIKAIGGTILQAVFGKRREDKSLPEDNSIKIN